MAETWHCKYAEGCTFQIPFEGAMSDAQLDEVRKHAREVHGYSGAPPPSQGGERQHAAGSGPIPPPQTVSPELAAFGQAIGQAIKEALLPVAQTQQAMAIAIQELRSDMATVRGVLDEARGAAPNNHINGTQLGDSSPAQSRASTVIESLLQLAMTKFMAPSPSGGVDGITKQFESMGLLLRAAMGFANGIAQEVRLSDQTVIKGITDIIMASAKSGADPIGAVSEMNRRAGEALESARPVPPAPAPAPASGDSTA